MDWIQVWRFATSIMGGATYNDLVEFGAIKTEEDKKSFAEAMTNPAKYANELPDSEPGGAMSMSDELFRYLTEGGEFRPGSS